ncbi:MAG: hypothetical protein NZM25_04360 [Leptospiraceae bacterium]|nr:hypothetical protein [Leptospiraceae bacterium]MDW8305753.1 hypothetical protein [Leptospiraceae bacterium]
MGRQVALLLLFFLIHAFLLDTLRHNEGHGHGTCLCKLGQNFCKRPAAHKEDPLLELKANEKTITLCNCPSESMSLEKELWLHLTNEQIELAKSTEPLLFRITHFFYKNPFYEVFHPPS